MRRISALAALLVVLSLACGISDPAATTSTPAETTAPEVQPTVLASTQPPLAPTDTPIPTGRVTLHAVGDLMLERDIITLMDEHGSIYPFAAVADVLGAADITIANMEGTFTERGTQATKFYTFRTPPRHAIGLAQAGIDVVALGNNHTMDYGAVGLQDTLKALADAEVPYSGAGTNATEARKPVLLEVNGLRLAFLSYNGVGEATFAGASSPGVARADIAWVRQDVASALTAADVVIVSLHDGTEYQDAPTGAQRAFAQAAIDVGAALVLGSHAHVFQGWQSYGDGIIVWGLGNFVFDLDFDDLATLGPRPFQTAIMRFEMTKNGVQSVEAVPVYIDPAKNRPVIATGEQKSAIEDRIQRLNAAFR
jgi:poly-gamma-glutamate capsule biosynthesis protein CapA/YwtB (metallophosphatase superfamily)